MWVATQRVFVVLGAAAALLIYALEFQKSCGQVRPHQCMKNLVGWVAEFVQDMGWTRNAEAPQPTPPKNTPVADQPQKLVANKPPPEPTAPVRTQEPTGPTSKVVLQTPAPAPSTLPRESGDEAPPPQAGKAEPSAKVTKLAPGPTAEYSFTVLNASRQDLWYFYATSCDVQHWGPDLLGRGTIDMGQRRTLTLRGAPGNCCFDLRAKFRDDEQLTKMGVDVCQNPRWTITER